MKNERDWSRLNYGGVDGLHKARRSSRSTAQRMVSCCFLPLRNAGRTAHATTMYVPPESSASWKELVPVSPTEKETATGRR